MPHHHSRTVAAREVPALERHTVVGDHRDRLRTGRGVRIQRRVRGECGRERDRERVGEHEHDQHPRHEQQPTPAPGRADQADRTGHEQPDAARERRGRGSAGDGDPSAPPGQPEAEPRRDEQPPADGADRRDCPGAGARTNARRFLVDCPGAARSHLDARSAVAAAPGSEVPCAELRLIVRVGRDTPVFGDRVPRRA